MSLKDPNCSVLSVVNGYNGGGGTYQQQQQRGGFHQASSPGPADVYGGGEYVQQAASPQPQSNGYHQMHQHAINRVR